MIFQTDLRVCELMKLGGKARKQLLSPPLCAILVSDDNHLHFSSKSLFLAWNNLKNPQPERHNCLCQRIQVSSELVRWVFLCASIQEALAVNRDPVLHSHLLLLSFIHCSSCRGRSSTADSTPQTWTPVWLKDLFCKSFHSWNRNRKSVDEIMEVSETQPAVTPAGQQRAADQGTDSWETVEVTVYNKCS